MIYSKTIFSSFSSFFFSKGKEEKKEKRGKEERRKNLDIVIVVIQGLLTLRRDNLLDLFSMMMKGGGIEVG